MSEKENLDSRKPNPEEEQKEQASNNSDEGFDLMLKVLIHNSTDETIEKTLKAVEQLVEEINFPEDQEHSPLMMKSYYAYHIGQLFYEEHYYLQSIHFLKKSLHYLEQDAKEKAPASEIEALNNSIAKLEYEIARVYFDLNEINESEKYVSNVLEKLSKLKEEGELHDTFLYGHVCYWMSLIEKDRGNLSEAEKLEQIARKNLPDDYFIVNAEKICRFERNLSWIPF